MCLIKGLEKHQCTHALCRAASKPNSSALFKSNYIMNAKGLQDFKLSSTLIDGRPYILPVNPFKPGTRQRNNFELFRQSERAFTEVVGDWPGDRYIFKKSEVSFILIEESVFNTFDLKEVAIYCG